MVAAIIAFPTSGAVATIYNVTITGCSGASDKQQRSGSIGYFNPASYYSYSAMDVSKVQSEVSTYAGATLSISVAAGRQSSMFGDDEDEDFGGVTGISNMGAEAIVVDTKIFNIEGTELPELGKGLNIIKKTYSNGKTEIKKVMIR